MTLSPTHGFTFGNRLEYVRDDHKMTIKAMAASIGVSYPTWRKYEKDESFPPAELIWKFCGIYHVNREWLDTNEGEMYTDGYKPGDPLGDPIPYGEAIIQEIAAMQDKIIEEIETKGTGTKKSATGTPEDRLNRILADLEEIQNRVAELSDELDSDTLEEAEGDLDIVIDRIIDVIEEHGWEVK